MDPSLYGVCMYVFCRLYSMGMCSVYVCVCYTGGTVCLYKCVCMCVLYRLCVHGVGSWVVGKFARNVRLVPSLLGHGFL